MSWQTVDEERRRRQWSRRMRRTIAALIVGLALVVAACGTTTTTPGGQSTATVKPTPMATPIPCSAWRIIPSSNATKYQMNVLSGVSALSPTAAWAVGGNYAESGPVTSLIEQWDGTSWQVVASPGPDFLSGVSAISPQDVWAVGSVSTYQVRPTALIEHWNGSQWSIVPAANTGASTAVLKSVVALAGNDVWAVGGSELRPLVEHWNGTSWQVVPSPTPDLAKQTHLTGVTHIPGTNQLWAVGEVYTPVAGYTQSLIERWDGSAWHIVASPALPSGAIGSTLLGIVALSATDAWAVGNYTASDHTVRTLIAHWDGTAWTVAASPDTWGSLSGVAAAGAHDVRAIGYMAIGDGNNQPVLIEQWNGSTWMVATTPEPSGASVSFGDITTDTAGNFWVIGSARTASGVLQTLTAHCP